MAEDETVVAAVVAAAVAADMSGLMPTLGRADVEGAEKEKN